jgi:hypothetical protein
MSLQSVYDVLEPLAQQGQLTIAAVQEQVPQVSLLALSLPSLSAITLASATVNLSSGTEQTLTITATASWGLFNNLASSFEITSDPTAQGQYLASFSCELGDNSGLSIPGVPWFSLSEVSVGGQTNPSQLANQELVAPVDVFITTTLLIQGDSSQTPIPIQLTYDSLGGIQTTLNAASVDLPSINDILAAFGSDTSGISLPDGLNSLLNFSLLELSVGFTPPSSVTRIGVTIGNSPKDTTGWAIIPGVFTLDSYKIGLTIANPLVSASRQIGGLIQTQVSLGSVDIGVSAIHPTSGGWQFSGYIGKENPVPIGELVSGLASQFGVTLPAALNEFTLSDFEFQFDTQTTNASGQFTLNFTVNQAVINLTVTASLTKGSSSYSVSVGGKLIIGTAEFDVSFTSQTDKVFQAEWSDPANPLQFSDIANAFGWTNMPSVPSSLDLSLTSASFIYDFTSGNLIFGAQSKNYGTAIFAAISVSGSYQYDFLLSVGQSFSLSNLPLVGQQLAAIENIEVGDIEIILSSVLLTAPVITQINTLIAALNAQGATQYPSFPTTPPTGVFILQAQLTFGTQAIPLNLQLGGGPTSSQTALPAPQRVTVNAPGALATTNAVGGVATSSSTPTTTWFNVQKSFGPVSFQRIGAMYQSDQQVLWFELDATLAFGPITMDLVGLGLGSPLTSFAPQFSIQGLGISYSAPPLTIAGSLTNLAPPGADYIEFEGGVTIGTGNFTVMAFGYYGNKPDPITKARYSSFFIFGDIAYDFGGPPAFFVTGIALGFGYNSSLRIPTIDEVTTFPFVEVLPTSMVPNTSVFGTNPTPQSVLDVIMNTSPAWVTPQQGSLWFAAGITFTSFEMVNSQALILVQVGQELIIALVGTSRAQFPQGAGSGTPVYAYIELDLLVEFAPSQGVFSVQAVLAKSSFLLDKACVLTGGFAFFVWYGPNPHAGDFVLTLGGYNPGFTPPSYYPKVPEVGFHWSLDSSISITGGAYFAFTPSVLMVGGELNATYQSGNLKAWFDAHADIIVQWNPFWFDASFGISIGASYKVDLWFTSFTVTAELGCNLEVWGPPTGGSVGVDWYIISFSIPFGSSKNSSQPVINQWSQVQAMLPNSGTAAAPNVVTLSPASGLTPTATSPAKSVNATPIFKAADAPATPAPWIVRGSQFSFNTSSSIPASSAAVGGFHEIAGSQFNVVPLGWTGVSATHVITIVDSANKDVSLAFSVSPSFGNVPSQLWGTKSESTPDASSQLVPNQLVGLSVVVNPPEIGGSAGAVNVAVNLANINLNIPDALIGLSTAPPTGDIAVNSGTTLAVIVDPNTGIASTSTTAVRTAILTALRTLQYAPNTKNDPLTNFASQAGGSFSAVPLLVA